MSFSATILPNLSRAQAMPHCQAVLPIFYHDQPICALITSSAGSYLVYAALNVAAFIFLEARMVETKQRSAESIQAELVGE